MQINPKWREMQFCKICWRLIEFHQRIAQMLDNAMSNAAAQLMMGGRGLNQALYEEAPPLGMALPDFFPNLVRPPIFAGIEQRHTFGEIRAIVVSELRREPARGGRGRRQAVRVR